MPRWDRLLQKPLDPRRLNGLERAAAFAVGVATASLAYLALSCPPDVKVLADTACCGMSPQEVDADTQWLVILLALLSAASLLISLLGVRFTRISAGKDGFELAVVNEVSEGETRGIELASVSFHELAASSELAWEKLPEWARIALDQWGESAGITRRMRFSILSAEKEEKRWSRAWEVTVLLDEGRARRLRLTYGRGSARVAG
jgi:hypothetical protein